MHNEALTEYSCCFSHIVLTCVFLIWSVPEEKNWSTVSDLLNIILFYVLYFFPLHLFKQKAKICSVLVCSSSGESKQWHLTWDSWLEHPITWSDISELLLERCKHTCGNVASLVSFRKYVIYQLHIFNVCTYLMIPFREQVLVK